MSDPEWGEWGRPLPEHDWSRLERDWQERKRKRYIEQSPEWNDPAALKRYRKYLRQQFAFDDRQREAREK